MRGLSQVAERASIGQKVCVMGIHLIILLSSREGQEAVNSATPAPTRSSRRRRMRGVSKVNLGLTGQKWTGANVTEQRNLG